jgi:hypothetical protein
LAPIGLPGNFGLIIWSILLLFLLFIVFKLFARFNFSISLTREQDVRPRIACQKFGADANKSKIAIICTPVSVYVPELQIPS